MAAMSVPRRRTVHSTRNPLVQQMHSAAAGEGGDVMLAEGVKLVAEGLQAGLQVRLAAVSPKLSDLSLADALASCAEEFVECSDAVLARASALETHQGIAVVFARPSWRVRDLLTGPHGSAAAALLVVAAGVRDPGNLGALLRSSEAAGATGLITLKGSADPFRDKAARGSMGSVFRLPVIHGMTADEIVGVAADADLRLVVAAGAGAVDYTACDLRAPTALVVGAEAQGVPVELTRAASSVVRIPLCDPVESLNVAVATGVLLFEARRQRS